MIRLRPSHPSLIDDEPREPVSVYWLRDCPEIAVHRSSLGWRLHVNGRELVLALSEWEIEAVLRRCGLPGLASLAWDRLEG
jgi:hypothetical protein